MESTAKRLIKLREHLKLNQSQFAKKIGVSSGLINKIETGNAKLSEINIRNICHTFRVKEDWLRHGNGEMQSDDVALSDEEKKLLDVFRKLSLIDQEKVIEYTEERLALQVLKVEQDEAFRLGTEGKALKMVIEKETPELAKKSG